jgi:hypothetical protein
MIGSQPRPSMQCLLALLAGLLVADTIGAPPGEDFEP